MHLLGACTKGSRYHQRTVVEKGFFCRHKIHWKLS